MADEVSLADDSTATQEPTTTDTPAFAAQWQPTDTTSLLPGNLPLTRPKRAYERAPASPFTRRQIRVGKIFKRAAPSLPLKAATRRDADATASVESGNKLVSKKLLRLQAKADAMAPSPLKVLKKRCLPARSEDGEGRVGTRAQVVGWENRGREILGRKIVTRSGRRSAGGDGEAGLVALAEEGEAGLIDEVEGEDIEVTGFGGLGEHDIAEGEDEAEVVGTVIEILDEDGKAVEGDKEDENAEGWSDVEPEESVAGAEDVEEMLDIRGDASDAQDDAPELAPDLPAEQAGTQEQKTPELDRRETVREPMDHTIVGTDDIERNLEPFATTSPQQSAIDEATIAASEGFEAMRPIPALEAAMLPDGFVSPVKRAPRASRRTVKEALAARRRTLPIQFAPAPKFEVDHTSETAIDPPSPAPTNARLEEAWEDVPESEQMDANQTTLPVGSINDSPATVNAGPAGEQALDLLSSPRTIEQTIVNEDTPSVGASKDVAQAAVTETNVLPRAPVENGFPTQQPLFKARKSPRRKSSSPIKTQQHAVLKGNDIPHLVAFSPIKRLEVHYSTNAVPALDLPPSDLTEESSAITTEDTSPEIASPFQRSSSAPPEEPKMSPQRPNRPRVSDDTALLQAFLSRAAANKTTKRATTARRESASNRRDSETVKQALASPAKPEVLADLDPNTSSPRKAATQEGEHVPEPENAEKPDDKDDATYEPRPKTRRSTRDRKRAPQNPLSAQTSPPNRIAVRGRADPVVLKKTEAQELALSTRNNTRKNKGGSVLPHLRLTKLVNEVPPEAQNMPDDAEQHEAVPVKKGIKWDETLTYFFEVPAREAGLLELGSSGAVSQLQTESAPLEDVDEVGIKPPPPADTPSKPKVRRLKPPKPTAASAAAKGVSATPPNTTADPMRPTEPTPAATKVPATRKPRSRIATPAAKRTTSPPAKPDEAAVTATEAPAPANQKPSALPKTRRPAVSKLPAPASMAAATNTNTNLSASLLASPAKKRKAPMPDPLPASTSTSLTASSASGKGKGIPAPKSTASGSEAAKNSGELGLASPAKKPKGRVGFAGDVGGGGEEARGVRSAFGSGLFAPASGLGLGLSSPAKRRRR